MNLTEWREATRPSAAGISDEERKRREEVRARVLKAAGTTIGSVRVASFRKKIGLGLLRRLADATKNEQEKILITDELGIKE